MSKPKFDTLEAAQAEIVRLNEVVTQITNERDTLSQNNATLSADLESVRKLNQQYFNKLSAQFPSDREEPEDPPEVPSVEEFAKTLNIL